MPILEIDKLSFGRTSRGFFAPSIRKEILKNVSLSISGGTTVGLIGESGSGKSTLARCIAGIMRPSSGRIIFAGMEIFPQEENRSLIGTQIQLLFQNHTASLDPRITIKRSLMEGIRDSRVDKDAQLADLLSIVELRTDVLNRQPGELSGGQRQRVALARALSAAPRLLILDEPTSALDELTQAEVLETISRIQKEKGLSILYITHDLRTAFCLADDIAVMRNGSIIEAGPRDSIADHPTTEYTRTLIESSIF